MGVSIPGISLEGGLVEAADGEVWLVGEDRTRKLVEGGRGNSTCTSLASAARDLSTYPIQEGQRSENVLKLQRIICNIATRLRQIYTSVFYYIVISKYVTLTREPTIC